MQDNKRPLGENNRSTGRHEHPLPHEISSAEQKTAIAAREQAEKDMEKDAELTASNPNDDLDEGETARLGEEQTGLV